MNQAAVEEFLDVELARVIERAREQFGSKGEAWMFSAVELARRGGADSTVLGAAVKERIRRTWEKS
jgi:nucleotide-binding universal stress UspA family protein